MRNETLGTTFTVTHLRFIGLATKAGNFTEVVEGSTLSANLHGLTRLVMSAPVINSNRCPQIQLLC